jgi:putative glycerol-1-phosphate prenyltransferase
MKLDLHKTPQLGILVDPDKARPNHLEKLVTFAKAGMFDFFLVGGSLTHNSTAHVVDFLKLHKTLPVVLFPGDIEQIVYNADAVLFLSLVSGRNPEYLIGKHVLVAKRLKNSTMQIIPTAYILISSENPTAVQYITQTQPIPRNKPELVVATALAAELLGMKMIYLEAGSNADEPVSEEIVRNVKKEVNLPLIVGGGIRTPKQMLELYNAGADIIVIGSAVEENPNLVPKFARVFRKFLNSRK